MSSRRPPEKFTIDGLTFSLVAEGGQNSLPINYAALVPQWTGVTYIDTIPGYKPFYIGIIEQSLPVGQGGGHRFAFIGFYDTPPASFTEAHLRQMHAYRIIQDEEQTGKAHRLAALLLGVDLKKPSNGPVPMIWPEAAPEDIVGPPQQSTPISLEDPNDN